MPLPGEQRAATASSALRAEQPVGDRRRHGTLRDFLQRRDGRRRLEHGDWMLLHDRCGTYEVFVRLSGTQLVFSEDSGPLPTQDDTDSAACPIFALSISDLTVIEIDPACCAEDGGQGGGAYMRLENRDDVFLVAPMRDRQTTVSHDASIQTWVAVLRTIQTETLAEARGDRDVPLMEQVARVTRAHIDPNANNDVAQQRMQAADGTSRRPHVAQEPRGQEVHDISLRRDVEHLRSLLEAKNSTIAELTRLLRRLEQGGSPQRFHLLHSDDPLADKQLPQIFRRPRTQAHRSTPPAEERESALGFTEGPYAERPATAGGVLLPVSAQLADEGISTLPDRRSRTITENYDDEDDDDTEDDVDDDDDDDDDAAMFVESEQLPQEDGSHRRLRAAALHSDSVQPRLGDLGPDAVDLTDPAMERLYREINADDSDTESDSDE